MALAATTPTAVSSAGLHSRTTTSGQAFFEFFQ
jgi:hypothetical protein